MFETKECANGTDQGCILTPGSGTSEDEQNEWLEETVWYGMRMWHCIFLSIGATLSVVILLCCCFKFRIPRTKQEIEGDYIRRKIMRKFRKRLKAIQNQELDEMDLKKALDKIRTELKSDTESLQQSDVLSGATFSSAGGGVNPAGGGSYRRASQIQIDISLEDLRIQTLGLGARIALAFNRFFKSRPSQEKEDEEAGNVVGEEPTTALLPPKKQGAACITPAAATDGGGDGAKKKKEKKEEGKGGGTEPPAKKSGKEAESGKLEATTSKEKGKENKKKDGKESPPTTIVTTEKETGKGDKKEEKKKGKKLEKETEQNKSKKEAESGTTNKDGIKPENKEAEKGTQKPADKKKK